MAAKKVHGDLPARSYAVVLAAAVVLHAVGLGVSDTWIDWRRRLKHSLSGGSDRS